MEKSGQEETLASAQAAMVEAAKAIVLMIAKTDQREMRMHETLDREILSLRSEVTQVRGEVATLVGGASAQIAAEAKQAMAPVAASYDRAVTATSAQLHSASKTCGSGLHPARRCYCFVSPSAGWCWASTGTSWPMPKNSCRTTKMPFPSCKRSLYPMQWYAAGDCASTPIQTARDSATSANITKQSLGLSSNERSGEVAHNRACRRILRFVRKTKRT